ncbi:hypothetical protein BDN70DRAFT_947259 [Pholiota conissans]|uniref:Uncharacterized protein n=1 Tax=Pholiota conissans TaxID=109636 RepID=A0A9P5YYI1_9AGAR|nr:hypothetical protein BDN70DRAFT_947259 [Pholiota conissans]
MRLIFAQFLVLFSFAALSTLVQANPELEKRIVLLPLTKWAEQHITDIMNVETNADLQDAMDAFISKNVAMEFNGATVKRDDYIKSLKADLPGRVTGNASFSATVEVPTDPTSPVTAGWVGMFYITNSVYPSKQVTRTFSDNFLIQQDPSIPVPNNTITGIRGDFDGRRVMAIKRVFTEVTN